MVKSRFVGLRLTTEEDEWVEKLQDYLGLDSKTAVFSHALQQLAARYNLAPDDQQRNITDSWQSILCRITELQQQSREQVELLEGIKEQNKEVYKEMIENIEKVEKIVDHFQGKQDKLIQILLEIQKQSGWISRETIDWLSSRLDVPKTRIYHITTFYKAFSLVPRGRHEIAVCMGTACHVREAPTLLSRIEDKLEISPGENTRDNKFTLDTVNCLGCCALGPVVKIDDEYYSNPSNEKLDEIFAQCD